MAIDLTDVGAGIAGFIIRGQDAIDLSSWAVSRAGDFNGDGFDDIIIGAPYADGPNNTRNKAGDSYVVFGQAGGFPVEIDLANVAAGIGGFVIHGENAEDHSGSFVSSAGDINSDGFDDIIIGAPGANGPDGRTKAGASYVIFGHAGPFAAAIDLRDVAAGNGGFVILGEKAGDSSGVSVASAGDIDGDGFDELIIGAGAGDAHHPRPSPRDARAKDTAGSSYVVFGQGGAFPAVIDLADVADGIGGFVIRGEEAGDFSGRSAASAGDFNGDGYDDIIIGADAAGGPSNLRPKAGDSYVIFGHAGAFPAEIHLADVAAGIGGFAIRGEDADDRSGRSVASAGDINGDGYDDIIIGARHGQGPDNTREKAGDAWVVFGHAGPFPAEIDLADVAAGIGGFAIRGQDAGDFLGRSSVSAGDINGDGYDDIVIGAKHADGLDNTRLDAGDSYVIFGRAGGFPAEIDLADVAAGIGGFVIHGAVGVPPLGDEAGFSVSGADVDGDGFSDLIIGARYADGPGDTRETAGDTYILFGSPTIGGSPNHVTHLGTAGNNTLIGNKSANVMVGGRGDDILLGNGGADVLIGGAGNDTLTVGGKTFLRVDGGSGFDTLAFSGRVKLADADFRRVSNIESLKLGSGTSDLTLGPIAARAIGGLAADDFRITIDGSLATNAAVKIDAGALNRPLTVNLAHNTADVTLKGGSGDDVFIGGSGNDTLVGGDGDDTLKGGAGNDVIHGGAGNDILRGNEGQDSFVFNTALNASTNVDRIPDFNVADDTIWLDNAIFTALTATGVLGAGQFFTGPAAHDANDRIIYNSATGVLLYDADGDGPGAAVPFAKLPAGLAVTHEDFLVM